MTPNGLLGEFEVHVDLRQHLDGLAVQQSRLVDPLADGIQGGARQQRMSARHAQALDHPAEGDDGLEANRAGNARLPGERRIHGHHLVHDLGSLDDAPDSYARSWRRRRLNRLRRREFRNQTRTRAGSPWNAIGSAWDDRPVQPRRQSRGRLALIRQNASRNVCGLAKYPIEDNVRARPRNSC